MTWSEYATKTFRFEATVKLLLSYGGSCKYRSPSIMGYRRNVTLENILCVDFSAAPLSIILDVIKYCDHPRWYEKITPGGVTSDWRWHLWLEVGPPIGGVISNRSWLVHVGPHRGTHVTCRNQLFFWKKKEIIYCWLHQAITCLQGEM